MNKCYMKLSRVSLKKNPHKTFLPSNVQAEAFKF